MSRHMIKLMWLISAEYDDNIMFLLLSDVLHSHNCHAALSLLLSS